MSIVNNNNNNKNNKYLYIPVPIGRFLQIQSHTNTHLHIAMYAILGITEIEDFRGNTFAVVCRSQTFFRAGLYRLQYRRVKLLGVAPYFVIKISRE